MIRQPSLAGFEAGPGPTDGLFFAIFPDAETVARIAVLARRLRAEHGLTGRPLAAGRFHVSLHWLGSYASLPAGVVARAVDAAAAVSMPAFDLSFDRIQSFRAVAGMRPLVLCAGDGAAALAAFRKALGDAMARAGLSPFARSHYTPHLTLLYDSGGIEERAVEPVGWRVRTWVLVRSLLGRRRHVALARWPLRD